MKTQWIVVAMVALACLGSLLVGQGASPRPDVPAAKVKWEYATLGQMIFTVSHDDRFSTASVLTFNSADTHVSGTINVTSKDTKQWAESMAKVPQDVVAKLFPQKAQGGLSLIQLITELGGEGWEMFQVVDQPATGDSKIAYKTFWFKRLR